MFENFGFRDHPDTITITLAGQELPFFLGRRTFTIAKKRGVDPGDILNATMDADDEDLVDNIDAFAALLWLGVLVFPDIDVTREEIADVLSLREIQSIQEDITAAFGELIEEDDTAGNAERPTEKPSR